MYIFSLFLSLFSLVTNQLLQQHFEVLKTLYLYKSDFNLKNGKGNYINKTESERITLFILFYFYLFIDRRNNIAYGCRYVRCQNGSMAG